MRYLVTGAAGFIGSHLAERLLSGGHAASVRCSWSTLKRNALATQRVFEAGVAAGVKVVYASTSSVYGGAERYPTPEETVPRPNSPYEITELACEHLAAAYARGFGLDAVGLRYFTVYEPRQRPDMAFARVVDALARGGSFEVYGDGALVAELHLGR